MSVGNLSRRIKKLEQQHGDDLRVVIVGDGDLEPVQQPGEHLIVLRVVDMGE